jgi:aspartyl-tRNA(Asn)/glutamyl-tRNA(Gln) amidotransferase subunit A
MAYFFEDPGPEPETKAAVLAAVDVLRDAGASIVEVNLPYAKLAKDANSITWMGDAFAAHRADLIARWPDYGRYTREVLARGAFVLGHDYVQAQRVRTYWRRMVAEVMRTVDVLVTPTSIGPAPVRAEMETEAFMLGPGFTSQWNLTGQPAIAIPCGFSSETHLPLSMQIVGRPFEESTVLRCADAYQRMTDWHLAVPPVAEAVAA